VPHPIYAALIHEAQGCPGYDAPLERVCIGQVWTLVRVNGFTGLCMTPASAYTRTLSWPGTLTGRRASEVIAWLGSWQPFEACLAVATLNAVLSGAGKAWALREEATPLGGGNLAVFAALGERLQGQKLGVIGRYPGLDRVLSGLDYHCVERSPGEDDLPDPASEFLLPDSDWAFITASALSNKTLPRLLELARRARVVLMGPSMPWSTVWCDWGVDYLAGVEVVDEELLWRTAAEAGGVRIFEGGVAYRLLALNDGARH